MKYLILFFSISFLFMIQFSATAQKKIKKIETWEITDSYYEWKFCTENGYPDDRCIDRMRITFENFSKYHVTSITFILQIKNQGGTILYRKKHTVSIDLEPGEKAPCKEFYLKEKVSDFKYGFSDNDEVVKNIDVEVLYVK